MKLQPNDFAILHIGAFTPDVPGLSNKASSVPANLIQRNLLEQLAMDGFPEPEVVAYVPTPSFPASRKLFHFKSKIGSVRTLGHINLGALKILSLGVNAAWSVFWWALRNRRATTKLVTCYNLTAPPAAFIWPICRLMNVAFVPYIGDVYVPGETVPNSLLRRLEHRIQAKLIPEADGLIVCNAAIVEDFAPQSRAYVMDGGVTEEFLGRFGGAKKDGPDTFTVLFAAELDDLDGIQTLLGAIDRLHGHRAFRFKIFGKGRYVDDVVRLAASDDRVSYHGFVPYDELMKAYHDADLLLVLRSTSMRTQRYFFPFKLIECLATGTPVLTTLTGHVESEYADVAFLLREESPEALAESLRGISEWPQESLHEFGARARTHVGRNKTWTAQGVGIRNYLAQVLEEVA